MISLGTKIKSVEVSDIAYFFSEDKATYLVTKEGQSLPIDYSLDQLVSMLNPDHFFRVNRQFLVARPAIQTIHTYSAGKLKLDLTPPPGTSYLSASAGCRSSRTGSAAEIVFHSSRKNQRSCVFIVSRATIVGIL